MREYDRVSLEHGARSAGARGRSRPTPRDSTCGPAAPATGSPAGAKKLQDVFVDAKVPRAERDDWPVVVRDDEVVAVPGIVEDAAVRVTRT